MPAQPGDSVYNLIWKLVESVGGVPRPGDDQRTLLAKYLIAIGGTPIVGDTFYDLLVKILRAKGGTPRPGDNEWLLLVHWLQQEGECRRCGDSIYDLWKRLLELGESSPPVANGLLAGLTGYWTLDENSPRLDSKNGYDLTEIGTVGAAVGLLGNAAVFNISPLDYLLNASPDLGTHGGDFSISTWVKLDVVSPGRLFGKADDPSFNGWSIRSTGLAFALQSLNSDQFSVEQVVSDVLISAGVWYHVAATFSTADGKGHIWVNGQKTTDDHTYSTDASTDFEMGKEIDGLLDETAIWIGRALSDADVTILLNGGTPLPFSQYTL